MTRNTKKLMIIVLMLVVVGLYFVSGTYARYTDSYTGTSKVTVAKWAVKLKDGANAELNKTFDLPFTVEENSNVVSGKIAPATEATATLNLDLTGTEVAVDYTAEITKADLATFFGNSASNVTVAVTGGTTTEENGKYIATGTVDLVNDTATGVTAGTLTFPVTVTLQQHID